MAPLSGNYLKPIYEKLEQSLLLPISKTISKSFDNEVYQMNHGSEALLRKMEKIASSDGHLFTKLDAFLWQAILILDNLLFCSRQNPLFMDIFMKTFAAKFTSAELDALNISIDKLSRKIQSSISRPKTMLAHYKLLIFENYVQWINSLLSHSTNKLAEPFLSLDAFKSLFQYEISTSDIEKRTELDCLWGFIGIFLILSTCNVGQVSEYYLLAENQYQTFRSNYLSSIRASRYLTLIYHTRLSVDVADTHERLSCYHECLVFLSMFDQSPSLHDHYSRLKYDILVRFSDFLLTECSSGQYSDWISMFSSVKGRMSLSSDDNRYSLQNMNYYEAIIFLRLLSFHIVSNNDNLNDLNLILGSDMILLLERLCRYDIICDMVECIIQRDTIHDNILLEQLYCISLIRQHRYHQAGVIASRLLQRCHISLNTPTKNSDIAVLNERLNNTDTKTLLTDVFLMEYAKMLLYIYHCPFEALQIASLISDKRLVKHLAGVAWIEILLSNYVDTLSNRNMVVCWANDALKSAIASSPFNPRFWYSMAILKAVIEHEYEKALNICRFITDELIDGNQNMLEPVWCLLFLLGIHDPTGKEWILRIIEGPISASMLWLKAKWMEYVNPYHDNEEHPAIHAYCELLGALGRNLTSHVTFNPVMEEWNDNPNKLKGHRSSKISALLQKSTFTKIPGTTSVEASIMSSSSVESSHSPYHHRTLADYFTHPLFESWAMHRKQRVMLSHFGHVEPDMYEFVNRYRDIIPYSHKNGDEEESDMGSEYLLLMPCCLFDLLPIKSQNSIGEYDKYHKSAMTPMLIAILWADICYFFIRQERWVDAQHAIAEACYYDECNPFIQVAVGDWLAAAKEEYLIASSHYLLVLEMIDGMRIMSAILLQAKLGALFGLIHAFYSLKDGEKAKHYLDMAKECDPNHSQILWWNSMLNSDVEISFTQLEKSIKQIQSSFLFDLSCFLPSCL